MKIKDLLQQSDRKVVFSCEIFPPKKDVEFSGIFETVDAIHQLGADFISVTYGAGGSDFATKNYPANRDNAFGGGAGAAVLGYQMFAHVKVRVAMWRNPWSDPTDKGYQIIQALLAIGSGGLTGLGIGNSKQKHLYLPEPQNDFIFSVICEELGFIGALLVIFLFVALLLRGIYVAWHAKDKFGSMLVVGVIVQVTLQAVLNIAVVTKTIPNTGISLPFFSYGGTSLLMLLGEMGVVLSVSRQGGAEKV